MATMGKKKKNQTNTIQWTKLSTPWVHLHFFNFLTIRKFLTLEQSLQSLKKPFTLCSILQIPACSQGHSTPQSPGLHFLPRAKSGWGWPQFRLFLTSCLIKGKCLSLHQRALCPSGLSTVSKTDLVSAAPNRISLWWLTQERDPWVWSQPKVSKARSGELCADAPSSEAVIVSVWPVRLLLSLQQ